MAYKSNNIVAIDDNRVGSFANVTVQNNGFLEVNSSDGFQGTVAGYTSGGITSGPPSGGYNNIIDKFPFSSDTNATDVGDLTQGNGISSGQSSTTHGYTSGGVPFTNVIEKFPFATDTNGSDVGNLTQARSNLGSGNSSSIHGYASGGFFSPSPVISKNTIDKFPFATDTNATDVGDLTVGRYGSAGQSSTNHGYNSGGSAGASPPFTGSNIIDKFPFATDTNATDVGDLQQARSDLTGQSSTTHGYASGGVIPPANPIIQVNTIEKFPFASDTNATDIADMFQARYRLAGQSSTASGYNSGGGIPPNISLNVIDKFPFATDSNATDVGDLNAARRSAHGQQD